MGIGVEEGQRQDGVERGRAGEPLERVEYMESIGPFVVGAGDQRSYRRVSVRRGRTRGTPHRPGNHGSHWTQFQPGPNQSVLVRRFLFHKHVRRPGQSVAQFAGELKRLSDQCGFGFSLDELLRDRFLCGLREEVVQRRLLEEDSTLSFDRALELALQMEATGHVRDLYNGTRDGHRAVAVLHVVRDVDQLLVVKDKVPCEQNRKPGMDKNCNPGNPGLDKNCNQGNPGLDKNCNPGNPGLDKNCNPGNLVLDKNCKPGNPDLDKNCNPGNPDLDKNCNPGPDQNLNPTHKDPEPVRIKEEKDAPLEGRLQCVVQDIPVLDSFTDLKLWAIQENLPPGQKDSRPGLEMDKNQDDPHPSTIQEELETLYAIKEREQHQTAMLVLGCPADMHQLLEVKENSPSEPSLDQHHEGPAPHVSEEPEEARASPAPEGGDMGSGGPEPPCLHYYGGSEPPHLQDQSESEPPHLHYHGGPDPPHRQNCVGSEPQHLHHHGRQEPPHPQDQGGSEPNRNPDLMKLRKRPAPHSDMGRRGGSILCCPSCGKGFVYRSCLKKHMMEHQADEGHAHSLTSHTPQKLLTSSTGEKNLSPKIYLKNYMMSHRGERKFICLVCDKIFVSRKKLAWHRRCHEEEKRYPCPVCGLRFYVKSSVPRHMMKHSEKKPQHCHECGIICLTEVDLARHMRRHTSEKPYMCPACGKICPSIADLAGHMAIHTRVKLYSCPVPGKICPPKAELAGHMRINTTEKPYSCSDSEKKCETKSALTGDMATPKGVKLYSCRNCRKICSSKADLLSHLSLHKKTRESCSECGKMFSSSLSLERHMILHTGEKPYQCSVCNQRFHHVGHFKSHMIKFHRFSKKHFIVTCLQQSSPKTRSQARSPNASAEAQTTSNTCL